MTLTRHLAWRLAGLTGLTTVLLAGAVYALLARRLDAEFTRRVEAQRGQVGVLVRARLDGVRAGLASVARDNSVRVTLMLGARSQLGEALTRARPIGEGDRYAVRTIDGEWVTPRTLADRHWTWLKEDRPPPPLTWVFREPIVRRTELLGHAFVIYELARDGPLMTQLARAGGGDLYLVHGDRVERLLDGGPRDEPVPDLPMEPVSGAPGLYQASPEGALQTEKHQVLFLITGASALALAVALGFAVHLARQVATPLSTLASRARKISKGDSATRFPTDARFEELAILEVAFNHMLDDLTAAQERSRYRELFDAVSDPVWILDPAGRLVEANLPGARLLDRPPNQVAGYDLRVCFTPGDVARLIREAPETGPAVSQLRFTDPGTPDHIFEVQSRRIEYRGDPAVLAVARDVTDRVRSRDRLEESRDFLVSILNHMNAGLLILDDEDRVRFYNDGFVDLWQITPEELDRHPTLEELFHRVADRGLYDPSDLDRLIAERRHDLARRVGTPFMCPRTDGRLVEGQALRLPGDQILLVYRDVTEQVDFERQLGRAQKMEALGTLAGGIAHDFNNILMAMIGHTELVLDTLPTTDPGRSNLGHVLEAGDRARDLVRQILAFSRHTGGEFQGFQLVPLVKETLRFLRASLPATVEIRHRIDTGNDWIHGDPTQIHRLLVNLCVNAGQAMEIEGGLLEVAVGRRTVTALEPVGALEPGTYAELTVTDTGPGIPESIRDRIFDPFFTTKEPGSGTGLGLAAVHGIAESHQGAVWLESGGGAGTTFHVVLPRGRPEAARPPTSTAPEATREGGAVLLVEDEEAILDACTQVLTQAGYRVIPCDSSAAALERLRETPGSFDLMVTDHTMPRRTGLELAREARELRPDLPILLCTGDLQFDQTLPDVDEVLSKPFQGRALVAAVSRLILSPGGEDNRGESPWHAS